MSEHDNGTISLADVASVLLRGRRFISRFVLRGSLLALILILFMPVRYSSRITLSPATPAAGLAGIASLASSFGVGLPAGAAMSTPDYFVAAVKSRAVLEPLAHSTHAVTKRRWFPPWSAPDTVVGRMVDILDESGDEDDPALATELAMEVLSSMIGASIDRSSGLLTLTVRSHSSGLARSVADSLLHHLEAVTGASRRGLAQEERVFLEGRVLDAADSLELAEVALSDFLARNRQFRESPSLLLEFERLQRTVLRRSTLLSGLQTAFEQARLEEVRSTPPVTVLDRPHLPAQPDRRHRLTLLVVAVLLLTGTAGMVVLAREYFARETARDSRPYDDLARSVADTVSDLKSLLPGSRK